MLKSLKGEKTAKDKNNDLLEEKMADQRRRMKEMMDALGETTGADLSAMVKFQMSELKAKYSPFQTDKYIGGLIIANGSDVKFPLINWWQHFQCHHR